MAAFCGYIPLAQELSCKTKLHALMSSLCKIRGAVHIKYLEQPAASYDLEMTFT